MEMMYKKIAEALKKAGRENDSPTDFLRFYCLGKCQPSHEDYFLNESGNKLYVRDIEEMMKTPTTGIQVKTRRHLLKSYDNSFSGIFEK